MHSYLPDTIRREWLARHASREQTGPRAQFWRSLPALPERPESGHKGTFGTGAAIGGSRGMSGAIALTGSACVLAGAGLTRLYVPDSILDTVAQFQREYTTIPCPCDAEGRMTGLSESALHSLSDATALAVGPGLGRSDALDRLVGELFKTAKQPSVFDADALNALASAKAFTQDAAETFCPQGARILTPHPGEFARLFGAKLTDDRKARRSCAVRFLERVQKLYGSELRCHFTLVLKGRETIVATLDPEAGTTRAHINLTGNVNLATGGSGDVLTGIILGLLAQGMNGPDAARLGVALHGLAAELRASICSRGATASDAARFLACAIDYYSLARDE